MAETVEDILKKIPKIYLTLVDHVNKTLILNESECTGYMWDTKFKYWVFNIENQGYKLKYE